MRHTLLALAALCFWPGLKACGDEAAASGEPAESRTSAQRGYRLLLDTPYLTSDFHQQQFDQLWQAWEEPARSLAEAANEDERRRMTFSRYGLTPRPDDPRKSMQYVVGDDGSWTMNCFACHQGKVAGKHVPGVPNSLYALQTLSEDVRRLKIKSGQGLSRMDLATMWMPLGGSIGTTNAVMFGVVLMNFRDPQLNVIADRPLPTMTHHDHDAPPWWHYRRKTHLYIDGFAPKTHRALMQFTLVKQNGPETFVEREDDFRDIEAYLMSLTPPKYPHAIDQPLAERGREVFNQHCATCHGAYGADGHYPEKWVAIDEVGTDAVRLKALTPEARKVYGDSWFNRFGVQSIVANPVGYIAPPLDGIWASAPYFHNGSVPTLWHVLHPGQRPVVWQRSEDGYDTARVGLEVTEHDAIPGEAATAAQRRRYFDTRGFGKGATGHDFAEELDEAERRAVLEYLKTL